MDLNDLWNAINAYVEACGGDPGPASVGMDRSRAGDRIEEELRSLFAPRLSEITGRGPWMQLHSGKAFYPYDPQPNDFELEDIAWGLSHECRYNGQCEKFWSVAQHSICVMIEVENWAEGNCPSHANRLAFLAHMHDAEEGLIKDIPTPLKLLLRDYEEIKQRVRRAINEKFALDPIIESCRDFLDVIKRADIAVLHAEKAILLGPSPMPWETEALGIATSQVNIFPTTPAQARDRWLLNFHAYRKLALAELEGQL